MKWILLGVVIALFGILAEAQTQPNAQPQPPQKQQSQQQQPIDWNYARQLYQKQNSGQALNDDEKAYLARAKASMQQRNNAGPQGRPGGGAGAMPPAPTTQMSKTGFIPLCDMTADQKYKNEEGGLYGNGKNDPPPEQLAAARKVLAQVQKLDENGRPSIMGKIVLMSVGMSNTSMKFMRFIADEQSDRDKSPDVVLVNGAQGGMVAGRWMDDQSNVWQVVEDRLKQARVSAEQVQVIWLLQAIAGPAQFGDFPLSAEKLRDQLIDGMPLLIKHYPNLRLIYLSSRTYAGYATSGLNPEPYAYENAFAVRWLIQLQIKGDPRLNFDPAKGEVKAPVLLWGPYLWADGVNPRKSDGLTYVVGDYSPNDGTHPAESGQEKVAKQLQTFFNNELNAPWYQKGATR